MSFAISIVAHVPTLTQSGSDASWSGIDTMIAAVTAILPSTLYNVGDVRKPPATNGMWFHCTTQGTTSASPPVYTTTSGSTTTDGGAVFTAFLAPFSDIMGDLRQYSCHSCRGVVTGTLTITDPSKESPIFRRFATTNTAVYTSGNFASDAITPKSNGTHFTWLEKGPNNFTEQESWDGIWALRGGSIIIAGAVKPEGTGSKILTGVNIVSASGFGSQSIRWRSYATNLRLRKCRTYDVSLDLFNIPPEIDVQGFACEYVAQYVGSQFGGTDSLLTMSALSNIDGTFDFDNYSNGWVEIYNCAKGATLNVVCQQGSVDHCVPLFQNLNFIVSNLQGVVQDNVRFTCTDAPVSNSPTVTITTRGGLKTWDFRNPLVYTGITAGGGLSSSVPCLKVWHGASNLQNLRFPSSTATYRFCGYYVTQQDITVILGSDTAQTVRVAMPAASFLPLSEAAAAALTGIALAPSGLTGGTVTLTSARTASELWQYFRAWKPLNQGSDDSWSFNGTTLNIGLWTLLGLEFLTGNLVTSTATSNSGFNNVSVTGNVSQTTPTNLTNVTVSGTLTYNTASNSSVTFTTANIGTILNSNSGIITITPSGAVTIGNYSDPEINFLDSSLTLLNATSATIYSSASNRDTNTSPGATFTSILNFKHGSTVSGVVMSGTVYFRVISGANILLISMTLSIGSNVLDLSIAGQLAMLPTVTANAVWSASTTPYTTSGTFGNDNNVNKALISIIPRLK